jgi:alpha-glucoside transport system substrate-binding protein
MTNKFPKGMALVVMLILMGLVAACGDTTNTSAPASAATTAASSATTVATTVASGTTSTAATTAAAASGANSGSTDYSKVGPELVNAFAGKYKGTTVTFNSNCVSNKDCVNTFKDFQDKTGITVNLVPPGDQSALVVKITGNTIEDIVDITNPGFLASYAKQGKVVDLNKVINPDWLKANISQGFLDTTTVDGNGGKILGGLFTYINFKSAVWYPKKAFDAAGYKTPQTWAELKTLMDQIVKDGDNPWCIGIEAGGATGWPATDWIEDIMLRTTTPENYDKWTSGALPFTSPEVKNAFNILTDIWFNDKYVYGGRKTIATTNFLDAPNPMFANPPKCWLHKQANFITIQSFEKNKPGLKSGVDYDFFYFPPIDDKYGKPVLFAGDFFTMFHDRPEVRAVMQYTATYDWIKPWIKAGGEPISPLKNSNLADYTTDIYRKMAQTILSASTVRFDGSDLMPAEVGGGSFWKGVTDYVSGSANLDQALTTIQNGWNNVKK